MKSVFNFKIYNRPTTFVCIGFASILQWLIYQLLTHVEFSSLSSECFAFAQVFVVLLVAPFLAALSVNIENRSTATTQFQSLSPISNGKSILEQLAYSQIPLLCWILLSTCFALFATSMPFMNGFKILVVLCFYCFSAGAIGMWCSQVFKDTIFGTECTYFILGIMIGSAFLLMPLGRYIDNPQPFIQPVLQLNPLIAVCNIFVGMDVFRLPLLYELTPIPWYDYSYPAWYIIVFWQLVIGVGCFLWTWRIGRTSKFNNIF